jgi:dipeptidase D
VGSGRDDAGVTAASALAGLEPELVWKRFGELTRIARPSKNEDAAREHVLAWATRHGFETAVDDEGNAVVRVPPNAGHEAAPTVVLQSHLDMVCERDPDSPFDPREGRIHVVREGDWLAAEGTTLGADNGIGVAAALAVAEDPAVPHGPLELLFTVSEEQGLDGAKALDPALVAGRTLLNLDGTSDGALTIGCAGSAHTFLRLTLEPAPLPPGWSGLAVEVSGARGGHSGGDIARGRVNAIKALGRTLGSASRTVPVRLAQIEGGVSRNALPREARAMVAVPDGMERAFVDAVTARIAAIREQHTETDGAISVSTAPAGIGAAAPERVTARAFDLLAALPSGVLAMSPAAPETVETSTSVTVVRTEGGVLTLGSMTRSSEPNGLDDTVASLEALARLAGAEIEVRRSYPPWRPDRGSPLLATARSTFTRLHGREPESTVVHGGLECAVIGEKLPGVQMLSIGPTVNGPHAPGERLSISSTQRFYRFLGELLGDLSG